MVTEESITLKTQDTSLIVEIVGLAGAGKTTLVRLMSQLNGNIQVGPELKLRKIDHIPTFIAQTYSLLPVLFQQYPGSRWFTWDEIKSMAYLKGWPQLLSRQAMNQNAVILLDHGPVFKLATLHAFGPERLRNRSNEKWWDAMFEQWAQALDVVVWLDAPDTVLRNRINNRVQKHAVKGKSQQEAHNFLALYRESYEQILASLKTRKGPAFFQIDTFSNPIEHVLDEVLNICNIRLVEKSK